MVINDTTFSHYNTFMFPVPFIIIPYTWCPETRNTSGKHILSQFYSFHFILLSVSKEVQSVVYSL